MTPGQLVDWVRATASRIAGILLAASLAVGYGVAASQRDRPPDPSMASNGPLVVAVGLLVFGGLCYLAYRLWGSPTRLIVGIVAGLALLWAWAAVREGLVLAFALGWAGIVLCALAWWEPRVVAGPLPPDGQ